MRVPRLVFLAGLAAALCAGCDRVPAGAIEACRSEVRVLPARTDILVVVDDSSSMQEEQENLRRNLAAFVGALAASAIPHDFQLGVTTTDVHNTHAMSDAYPYWVPPYDQYAWEVPFPKGTLVAVDPGALTDAALVGKLLYDPSAGFGGIRLLRVGSPSLVTDFEANVLVGVHGSEKEEPLRAAELALTDRIADGGNAGFLRPGARLGIVVLTDEDDCSELAPPLVGDSDEACHLPEVKAQLESVAGIASFLGGPIAGEQRDPVVAVIAGFDPATLEPTGCATSNDVPSRLSALLDALGPERTLRSSICDESFGPALQRIADLLVPQSVPLDGTPPDPHMLVASVRTVAGAEIACPVVAEGEDASQAGAVYSPPRAGRPATLTFRGACRLGPGDRIGVKIVCAG